MHKCPGDSIPYTRTDAAAAAKNSRRKGKKPLIPYYCDLCNQWHVGRFNAPKRPMKTIYQPRKK